MQPGKTQMSCLCPSPHRGVLNPRTVRCVRAIALTLAFVSCCAGEDAGNDRDFSAIELRELSLDKLAEKLEGMKATYRGQTPEELLQLIEMLGEVTPARTEELLDQPDTSASFAKVIELILDLLFEWPSPEQNKAVYAGLVSESPESRYPALLTAGSSAHGHAVAKALLALARRDGDPTVVKEAVIAIRALAGSREPAVEAELQTLAKSRRVAIREASAVSLQQIRVRFGKWSVPRLDNASSARTASVSAPNILTEYRSLPTKPIGEAGVQIIVIQLSQRHRDPFTEQVVSAMTRLLKSGGTVLISNPILKKWPDAILAWARAHRLRLPTDVRMPPSGPGIPSYAHYRSFVDYPFGLGDQPGPAAEMCWQKWDKDHETPILACDRSGALVVVADKVLGAGQMVFTTVDLAERPIYNENMLRWLYGDALLSHTFQWSKTYSIETTGHTPHKPWARPLAGNKPKVLYLTLDTSKRGLLEIVQRLDAEWRYVPYDATFAARPRTKEHVPPSRMGQRAAALLDAHLPWADVLVFDVGPKNLIRTLTSNAKAGIASLKTLPARLRRKIFRRVHQDGMGLVCVSSRRAGDDIKEFVSRIEAAESDPANFLKYAKPLVPVPEWGADQKTSPRLMSAEMGSGRILWFGRYLPHVLDTSGASAPVTFPEKFAVPGLLRPRQPVKLHDYWYAMLVKGILWSCKRDGGATIRELSLTKSVAGEPGAIAVQLREKTKGTLDCAARDAWNSVTNLKPKIVDGDSVSITSPPLPAGWYILEAILRDEKGEVMDFAAAHARVESNLKIAGVVPERRFWKEGETARLEVKLSSPTKGAIHVSAFDTFGRMTVDRTEPVKAKADLVLIDVPVRHALSRLWDIHLTLQQGDREVDHWRQPIGIERPPPERDFTTMAGTFSREEEIPLFQKYIDIDSTLAWPETALRNNMALQGNSTNTFAFGHSATPGSRLVPNEREPCMSSPSFRMQAIRGIRQRGPLLRGLGVNSLMINDECPHGGRCFSRYCLSRFRWKLRQAYGDLAALNREWATSFKAWDEVMPLQGENPQHPGSYADFEQFSKWVFAEYSSFLEILANDHVPGFRAGHSSGPFGSFMHQLAGLGHYYGVIERYVSTGPPGAILGSWYAPGYRFVESHETVSRHWPWWHLFRGSTRIALWWSNSGLPGYHADFSRPYMTHLWLGEEMKDIRRGIGKLLIHARREEGPAAVYHSLRNITVINAVEEIEKKRQEKKDGLTPGSLARQFMKAYPRRASNIQRSVLDQQVECRVLSDNLVESGAIDSRNIKFIFLPGIVSLSATERKNLKQFVRKGGMLVADLNAGLRNEHGTWVGDGFAREMFGVTFDEGFQSIDAKSGKGNLVIADGGPNDHSLTAIRKLDGISVTATGRGVKTTDGIALGSIGELPALILKSHGAGKCLFLNFTVPLGSDYASALARDLMQLAKLEPVTEVRTEDGRRLPLDFGNFRDSEALYSGFVMRGKGGMVSDEDTHEVTVTFPKKGHVYDSRHGRYLGHIQTHKTRVTPSIAHVYGILPYRLEALEVQGTRECKRGDVTRFSATAKTGAGRLLGRQVWRVEVEDSAGNLQPAHAKRLVIENGTVDVELPIALNAEIGKWQLTVRDAATGVRGSSEFEVQP